MYPNLIFNDEPKLVLNEDSSMYRLVQRLAHFLAHTHHSEPILVSGDWGAGKTSVLKSLRQRLETASNKGEKRTIWFEAWRYDQAEQLPAALLKTVCDSQPKNNSRGWKELSQNVLRLVPLAFCKAAPALAEGFGMPFLSKLLKEMNPTDLAQLLDKMKSSDASELGEDPVAQLRDAFKKLIEEGWESKRWPIIFIDDLDRCNPENAVALLDAIRLLVADNKLGCRFVVALDRGVITKAISNKFHGIEGYDGNRYLEKVFPLNFHISTVTDYEAAHLIEDLLNTIDANQEDEAQNIFLDDNGKDALRAVLKYPVFANPRLMKRVMNRYRLILFFERLQKEEGNIELKGRDEDHMLVHWIAAAERWPRLRLLMQQRDLKYWNRFLKALGTNQESDYPGPEAKLLVAESGVLAWMIEVKMTSDLNVVQTFREVDQRLRRLGL